MAVIWWVPGAGGDQDRIAGPDLAFEPIDLHHAAALEQEVEFLAVLVPVALGRAAGGEGGLGQALVRYRGVREVENAADGRAVFGREGRLLLKGADFHGGLRIVD